MKLFVLLAVTFLSPSSLAQNETCPDGQVLCDGTVDECIPEGFICDGRFVDCSNDSDEQDCPCEVAYFLCPNSDLCLPSIWMCDDIRDCPGGEDEDAEYGCPPCEGFECKAGRCIPEEWLCDGGRDCPDGDDEEQDCPPCSQFECSDGNCIPEDYACDGVADCSNDEDDCPCNEDEFMCEEDGYCIPAAEICDGFQNCVDNSDEANCTNAVVPAVPFKGQYMTASLHEVKIRKPTSLSALSKGKIKRTQKKVPEERRGSSYSLSSQIKSR